MSRITWHVKGEESYEEKVEHHAGTFKKEDPIEVDAEVWNNRWGVENKTDIKTPILTYEFGSLEDSALLKYVSISIDGVLQPTSIEGQRGTLFINRPISGKANNGDAKDPSNQENFLRLQISVDTGENKLKNGDLKKMKFNLKDLE